MSEPRLRLRIYFDNGLMFGPGKADLLAGIAEHGSISAAGRAMGMSYKRAWGLVEEMNSAFTKPLVESARGGAAGGGAHLTDEGLAVLGHYRRLVDKARIEGAVELSGLMARMTDMSAGK